MGILVRGRDQREILHCCFHSFTDKTQDLHCLFFFIVNLFGGRNIIKSKPVFEKNSLLRQVRRDDEQNMQQMYLQLKEREEEEEEEKKKFCNFSSLLCELSPLNIFYH